MTAVSPSEYNAALTDIISYLECKPKSTFLAGLLKSGILVAIISVEFLGTPMHRSQIRANLITLHMSKDKPQISLSWKLRTEMSPLASKSNSHWRCLERASNAKVLDRQQVAGIKEVINKVKQYQLFRKITHDAKKLVSQKNFSFLLKCELLFQWSFTYYFSKVKPAFSVET